MTTTRVRWQITTDLSKNFGPYNIRICYIDVTQPAASPSPDLEEEVGDFIARQVLEKGPVFFEG